MWSAMNMPAGIYLTKCIILFVIFIFCKGKQIGFNNTCSISPSFLFPCSKHLELSIRAEVSCNASNGDKELNIIFNLNKERGKQCYALWNNTYGRRYSCWDNFPDLWPNIRPQPGEKEMFIITFGNELLTDMFPNSNFETLWHFSVNGKKCHRQKCSLQVNHSIFDNCSSTSPFTHEMTSTDQTVQRHSISPVTVYSAIIADYSRGISHVTVYSVVIAVTALALLLLFCFGYRYKQKNKIINAKFHELEIFPHVAITLYLAFLDDHSVHKEVVLKFANYLKERFGFQIKLELFDRETIYDNPASWLERSLALSDIVLVIWSPGAEQRWNNPDAFTDRLDLFTPVLNRIKTDVSYCRNRSKYMFAYFEYCSIENQLKHYCLSNSIPCVQLMSDFYLLCTKLADFANKFKNLSQKSRALLRKTSTDTNYPERIALEESIGEMTNLIQN